MTSKAATKWHEFGPHYDHACVKVQFAPTQVVDRGRSFPKLFKTDISNEVSKAWLKDQLDALQRQMLPHWDPHMRLEFVKSMLRSKTLELRQMNKRTLGSEVIKDRLNSLIAKSIFTRADIDCIEALKADLLLAEEQESETMRIRAGVKWREEGERSTRYFLSRFKARVNATTMQLLRAGSQVIEGPSNLLSFVKIIYSR